MPSSYLLVVYKPNSSGQEEEAEVNVFIPPVKEEDVTWSVPPPTLSEASTLFKGSGISNILSTDEVLSKLKEAIKISPEAIVHILPNTRQFPAHRADVVEDAVWGGGGGGLSDRWLLEAIARGRLIKSEWEVEQVRKANDVSSRAHEVVMRVLAEGVREGYKRASGSGVVMANGNGKEKKVEVPKEWRIEKERDAEAIFVASCLREGYVYHHHPSFLPSGRKLTPRYFNCCC